MNKLTFRKLPEETVTPRSRYGFQNMPAPMEENGEKLCVCVPFERNDRETDKNYSARSRQAVRNANKAEWAKKDGMTFVCRKIGDELCAFWTA